MIDTLDRSLRWFVKMSTVFSRIHMDVNVEIQPVSQISIVLLNIALVRTIPSHMYRLLKWYLVAVLEKMNSLLLHFRNAHKRPKLLEFWMNRLRNGHKLQNLQIIVFTIIQMLDPIYGLTQMVQVPNLDI